MPNAMAMKDPKNTPTQAFSPKSWCTLTIITADVNNNPPTKPAPFKAGTKVLIEVVITLGPLTFAQKIVAL
jgi:hypothetical protein